MTIDFPEGTVSDFWNSSESQCSNPYGSCETVVLTPLDTALLIDYSISYPNEKVTAKYKYSLSYDSVDDISITQASGGFTGEQLTLYATIYGPIFYTTNHNAFPPETIHW